MPFSPALNNTDLRLSSWCNYYPPILWFHKSEYIKWMRDWQRTGEQKWTSGLCCSVWWWHQLSLSDPSCVYLPDSAQTSLRDGLWCDRSPLRGLCLSAVSRHHSEMSYGVTGPPSEDCARLQCPAFLLSLGSEASGRARQKGKGVTRDVSADFLCRIWLTSCRASLLIARGWCLGAGQPVSDWLVSAVCLRDTVMICFGLKGSHSETEGHVGVSVWGAIKLAHSHLYSTGFLSAKIACDLKSNSHFLLITLKKNFPLLTAEERVSFNNKQ